MPYVESLNEFCERQRCTPLMVRDRYLFPNGAQSNGQTHFDPPNNPDELLTLHVEYLTSKLAGAVRRYNHDRDCIAGQAHYHSLGAGPAPAAGWEDHLKKMVAEIEQLQSEVAALKQQLPRVRQEQDYDRRRSQERQRAAAAVATLSQFPVY